MAWLKTVLPHLPKMSSLHWDVTGERLLFLVGDGKSVVWDHRHQQVVAVDDRFPTLVRSGALSSDGRLAVTVRDACLYVWSPGTSSQVEVIDWRASEQFEAHFVAFLPGTHTVLVGGRHPRRVRLFDLDTRQLVGWLQHWPIAIGVSVSPDGRWLLAEPLQPGRHYVVDLTQPEAYYELAEQPDWMSWPLTKAKHSFMGGLGQLALVTSQHNVVFWDLAQRQVTRTLTLSNWVHSISFTPDGRYMATSGEMYADLLTVDGEPAARLAYGSFVYGLTNHPTQPVFYISAGNETALWQLVETTDPLAATIFTAADWVAAAAVYFRAAGYFDAMADLSDEAFIAWFGSALDDDVSNAKPTPINLLWALCHDRQRLIANAWSLYDSYDYVHVIAALAAISQGVFQPQHIVATMDEPGYTLIDISFELGTNPYHFNLPNIGVFDLEVLRRINQIILASGLRFEVFEAHSHEVVTIICCTPAERDKLRVDLGCNFVHGL